LDLAHYLQKQWPERSAQCRKGKNMKNITKLALTTTITFLVAASLPLALQASEISGSIGFGSLGVNITGPNLASASSFTLSDPFITTETGVYSGAPILTPITFNGFQFNPPVASVTPLWIFNVGAITYSFDATSVTSYFDSTLDQWDIGGSGIAMVTGYDATPGTWNVNLSQSGASVVFDSSAAGNPRAGVPDGGSTLLLLGGGFVGMAGLARKKKG
jgi:VPDSG-CTERM motif